MKVCLFGEGGVGKTSLTRRFLTGIFNEDIKITMGANIFYKYLEVDGLKVGLQIWDFGGEQQFRFLLPSYAIGANGGIFMFDLTRYLTLTKTEEWLNVFNEGVKKKDPDEDVPIILVGGKRDLQEQISISDTDVEALIKKYDFKDYLKVSSLSGENVKEVFESITRIILKKKHLL